MPGIASGESDPAKLDFPGIGSAKEGGSLIRRPAERQGYYLMDPSAVATPRF